MIERDRRKLLIPGWAGNLTREELAYIKQRLTSNRRLRAKWGLGRGTGRLSEAKIRQVAMFDGSGHKKCTDLRFIDVFQVRPQNEAALPRVNDQLGLF